MSEGFIKLLSKEELQALGIYLDNANGAINPDGEVEIWFSKNKIPPWLRKKELRTSRQYLIWRTSVFVRDNWICQKCNQRGGNLQAHHIKGFKEFRKLRYEIENGITYCIKCHKQIHKKDN
jgi:hypothetical protein